MHKLIDAAVERYHAVVMILAFILVMGTGAFLAVPKESSPDVRIPIIYVSMSLQGISPEDGERLLLRPMEKKLRGIESVKEMRSEAVEGFASVVLEFEAGFNAARALSDVRAKVDEAKAELPEDAEEPRVQEVNFSLFPVINVILTGDVPERTLQTIARDLRDKIESLPSVLEARIDGEREESLEVVIDPLTLESYRLSSQEVFRRVAANHVLIAAGEMDTGAGRFKVQVPGLIEKIRDLRAMPLLNDGQNVVTLGDVAEIRRGFKDARSRARVNGRPAVGLAVSKRTGANIIETIEEARALVDAERAYWPRGVDVVYAQDTSGDIRDMLKDLNNSVLLAVLLVVGVIGWALGPRSAFMSALAIPGSFLIGVLCIAGLGFTLNIVVLFSLILSVGMLVDAAIIVTEHTDKLLARGESFASAYPQAAKRMSLPVFSSILTTVVVFLPLLFWPGIVGQFMKYMPITLMLTLSGSLLMGLFFLPAVGARMRNSSPRRGEVGSGQRFFAWLALRYRERLERVLGHPGKFALGLTAAMVVIIAVFATLGPGVEFFPKIEPANASLLVRARGNLSVDEMDALVKRVEARLAPFKDEVRVFYTRSGEFSRQEMPEDTIGVIQMEFVKWNKRRKADVILADMAEKTKDISGVIVETAKQQEGPPTGKPVQVEFRSRFADALAPAVTRFLEEGVPNIGDLMNVENDLPIPKIEWRFLVNREKAGRNDVSMIEIGNVIKLVTNGIKVSEYRPDDADDEIDILARFPQEYRNLSQLQRLRVYTPRGLEPLSNFVQFTPERSVGTIRRVDGVRAHNVKADLAPGALADAKVQAAKAWFAENAKTFDPRVSIRFRGEDKEQQEAGSFLAMAFGIALFIKALILTAQFGSFFRMLVLMSAVFFSTGGVLLGLLFAWEPFGVVMCGVAVIALAGVVVNNNIIFIDTYHVLREEGMRVREALVAAGEDRLRPILLTAGTAVLGLLPLVFQLNIDFLGREVTVGAPSSQWWTQLSTAIAGGLSFATVLTLFFTPCLLLLWEGRRERKEEERASTPSPGSGWRSPS